MFHYTLTVFEASGKLIYSDRFEAKDDESAKQLGKQKLSEHHASNQTHRLSRSGKLLLFHS